MKKLLLLLVSVSLVALLQAQTLDKSVALEMLAKNSNTTGLSSSDLSELHVINAYIDKSAGGITLVYAQQTHKGIPVHNQVQVFSFRNGTLVTKSGERIVSPDKLSQFNTGIATVPASAAVMTAIADRKLSATTPLTETERSANGQKIAFGNAGVSRENITAQLMWVFFENKLRLAWQVYIVQNNSSDYWQIRVDANNNMVIDMTNLTVYCNWDDPNHGATAHEHTSPEPVAAPEFFTVTAPSGNSSNPFLINSATYRVVPFPAESPIHPGGAHALKTDPWTMAPGNATSLKWHSDGTNDYNYSRGNNVWAQEDRNGNNGTGIPATSTTPDPLTFDFIPDYTVNPTQTTPVQNQQFNTTNLFYWNNIMHDISYVYGFDEAAANFQDNNQGRGGAGNDHVNADAQDGSGSNNANFSTPADGSSGRMQMFLWSGSPQKDGDVDNGVVVHEYTHGISNRLTGGGSGGCLGNAEHMGEGWSDYYSLMVTHDWANATLTDGFTKPRGIGTYVLGQAITGLGIRTQRYCTNLAINNRAYNFSISTSSHTRGEIWCATLWDMTWNIIQQVNAINPNLFNATGGGGNTIALRLVTQGMKLQPCSPGFLDGRDAILAADQLLYNGQYRCAIIAAFARRGMGFDAKQGSSNSVTDQVPGFSTTDASLQLTQNITQQLEGENVVYTNRIVAGPCGPVTNYLLTDTLPANVTYVSGGTYNSTTRVVSFPVNLAAGATQDYSFTVRINNGSYFPTVNLFEDLVTGAAIPATWTSSSTTSTNWVVSNARSHSAPSSYYSANLAVTSDQRLTLTNAIALPAAPPPLTFWHWYNTESSYDGGVLEISTDGGTNWTDLGPNITTNGYIGTFDGTTLLAGRQGWTGNSNGFIKTSVNLTPFANQSVKVRFRFTSDVGTNLEGWYVDDIMIKRQAVVDIRSNLFNASGIRLATSDTFTIILPAPVGCTPVAINTQPPNINTCTGSTATFTVAITGTSPAYQWQLSTTGCAGPFTNIAGATGSSYTTPATTAAMNNYAYRVVINNACPSTATSNCAVLTVNSVAVINTQPVSASVCAGENASFSIAATGTGLAYQWQVSTNGGTSFTDITGATNATYTIAPATSSLNNNQYRVLVSSTCSATGTLSSVATLTVFEPANISSSPANFNGCAGETATFNVTATGTAITYQWQQSTDGGITFTNIPGATGATYTTPTLNLGMDNMRLRVVVTGVPCGSVTSSVASLSVKARPTVELTAAMYSSLTPSTPSRLLATVSPPGNYLYEWFRDDVLFHSSASNALPLTVDLFGTYKVVVTDQLNGCTDTSSLVNITDSLTTMLFIYPNPTSGMFQVRYHSAQGLSTTRLLNVYDAKGSRVYSQRYPILRPYDRMDVDLTRLSSGVYVVELMDINNNRIITGRVIKR